MIELLSPNLLVDEEYQTYKSDLYLHLEKVLGEVLAKNLFLMHYSLDYLWTIKNVLEIIDEKSRPLRLLDVGCGISVLPSFFSSKGFEVYTCDRNKDCLEWMEYIEKKFSVNLRFTPEDILDVYYESNFFDIVISASSIEHNSFDRASEISKEIFRILKPGGSLIITLVSADNAIEYQTRSVRDPLVSFYTDEKIKEVFLPSGLTLKSEFNNFSELTKIWKEVKEKFGQEYLKIYTPIGVYLVKK